ncbi:uncharacterized protein LOC115760212 [Drosophila novamexicana]|uniref:uncharacterized protein LOC115760212 n=1 Tax=Drosophila novamexicana TaxID=47314 RepID=UPI0011E5F28D|nr:uncharacterized protein LOC115760212 [Drosophila novamexicana]XP_030557322.1 uncharacterized protein LOC115760212 [Drosophila novamexicana]
MSAQIRSRQISLCLLLLLALCLDWQMVLARTRDLCQVKPSTSSLCVPTTLGIYYDEETQHCHYMGCSNKRLFGSLEDCEKICNNARHVKRRNNVASSKTNQTTN